MKKFSILVLALLSLVGCSTGNEKKTAMEWAKMAVEDEHYILDDDGYLLTHSIVLQPPSLELLEEGGDKNINGILYGRGNKGYFYQAIFEHTLFVEKYDGKINKYVYLSAIAWRFKTKIKSSNPIKLKFTEYAIIDIDIVELEW